MPVFPERESTLVSRLHSKGDSAQDKRTWVIGHSSDNKGRESERFKGFRKNTGDSAGALSNVGQGIAESSRTVETPATISSPTPQAQQAPQAPARAGSMNIDTMMGTTSTSAGNDIMASLADLDLSSGASAVQEEPLLPDVAHAYAPTRSIPTTGVTAPLLESPIPTNDLDELKQPATLGGVAPSLLAPLTVAPNIEKVSRFLSSSQQLTRSGWNVSATAMKAYCLKMTRCKSASSRSTTVHWVV